MLNVLKKNKEIFIICILYGLISFLLLGMMTGGNAIVGGDSPGYIAIAKNLSAHAFFSSDGINAEYFRTPGYPLFLAVIYLLGGTNNIVVIVQIVLMIVKIFLFYRILIMLHTPKRLSLFGSLLLLFDLQSYAYSFIIYTESLFGFLLILSLYYFVKYLKDKKSMWFFLAFSLAMNYALFVRPILMYLNLLVCFVLLLFYFLKKIQFRCFALFLVFFMLVFCGWSLRNYTHSGVFIFSTVQKNNMQGHYAPIITAGSEYIQKNDVQTFIEGATDYHNEMFLEVYPEAESGSLNEAQISILRGKYGSQFIRTHFVEYIKVTMTGFIKMMLTPFQTELLFKMKPLFAEAILIKGVQLLYLLYILIVYALYLVSFAIGCKRCDAIQIIIFLVCAYLAIPGAIFATSRFRAPFFPMLVLSAVCNSGVIMQWLSCRLHISGLGRHLLHESDAVERQG